MPHINLGDVGNLERLTWAIYDGRYVLGSQLALSGLDNWACILTKVMTHIFHGRMLWEHCPLSTIGGANVATAAHLKGGPVVKLSGRRNQQKRPEGPQAPASPAPKTPTLWSIINVSSGATSAHADGGVMTASLDLEVVWWALIDPLPDGLDATSQALAKRLVAMWRWTFMLSQYRIYPPAPTSLNIGQFLP